MTTPERPRSPIQADVRIWWRPAGPDFTYDDDADESRVRHRVIAACESVAAVLARLIPDPSSLSGRDVDVGEHGLILREHVDATIGAALADIAVRGADYREVDHSFLGLDLPPPDAVPPDQQAVTFGYRQLDAGPREPYYWYDEYGRLHCSYDYALTIDGNVLELRDPAHDGWIHVFARVDFLPPQVSDR